MLPRSLSNFMNAFTSSDHTTYPFATTNKQDFQNLLSVYLDATLHPLLKEEDFRQEGWRLGPEDPRTFEKRGCRRKRRVNGWKISSLRASSTTK
jgi:Predicted Zn-dependent peptidases, insulinase-like